MKKLRLSLVLAFIAMAAVVSAQSASLSIKGGLNMSNYYGDDMHDKNLKPGFHIGVGAELEFMENIAVQSGLFFSSKGAKYQYEAPIVGDVKYNVTANYLQLPIHLAYKIDVTPGTKVVFHAGPYFAYGVGGKRKIESEYGGGYDIYFGSPEIDTFDSDWGFKPFDLGIGIGVGAEFDKVIVDLGWDMGLKDISRGLKIGQTSYSQNIRNQNAYLSVGYKF